MRRPGRYQVGRRRNIGNALVRLFQIRNPDRLAEAFLVQIIEIAGWRRRRRRSFRSRLRSGLGRTQGHLLLTGTGDIVNLISAERIQNVQVVRALHDIVILLHQESLSLAVLLDAEISAEAQTGEQDKPHHGDYENHEAVLTVGTGTGFISALLQILQALH